MTGTTNQLVREKKKRSYKGKRKARERDSHSKLKKRERDIDKKDEEAEQTLRKIQILHRLAPSRFSDRNYQQLVRERKKQRNREK